MLRNLLDKLETHGTAEDKDRFINVLSLNVSDIQYEELMKLDAELDDVAAADNEPPDEDQLRMRFPGICEGCEE